MVLKYHSLGKLQDCMNGEANLLITEETSMKQYIDSDPLSKAWVIQIGQFWADSSQ